MAELQKRTFGENISWECGLSWEGGFWGNYSIDADEVYDGERRRISLSG
jgi:hypothetical protein